MLTRAQARAIPTSKRGFTAVDAPYGVKNRAAVNNKNKTKKEHDECIRLFMFGPYIN